MGSSELSSHPLIDRSAQREVRQSRGFREVAAALTGADIAKDYAEEVAGAPRRGEAGKRYLVSHNTKLAAERKAARDGEHASIGLVEWAKESGPMELPESAGELLPLHALVPLRSGQPDKADASDPNHGINRVDFLGRGPGDRLAVGWMKFLAPSASRVGTGDTPLRALLEGLAHVAAVQANREAVVKELGEKVEGEFADTPPALFIVGSPKYWELCRKREAQKGAAWIRELERLSAEIEEAADVPVFFLSLRLDGDPGWNYETGGPRFEGRARLLPAWEPGAGRIRPKPKPRRRKESLTPEEIIVEADLSRPIRPYSINELFEAGDRIEHPTLGIGVVQGAAGPNKIRVHFDEKKSLLIHDRGAQGATP